MLPTTTRTARAKTAPRARLNRRAGSPSRRRQGKTTANRIVVNKYKSASHDPSPSIAWLTAALLELIVGRDLTSFPESP